jgi:flagellar biosynthesis protein FlhF
VLSEIAAQGFDRVIVDLPGLSSGACLRDLAAALGLYNSDSAFKTALHLVLPPSHDDAFTLTLLDRYHLDLPGSIIWSKLDEYGRYGALLNVALASGLPVSALSFGAGILNTLLPASQVMLWRLIFKHELPLHISHTGHTGPAAGPAGRANSPAAAYARAQNPGPSLGDDYSGDDL